MKKKFTLRRIILFLVIVLLILIARPVTHLIYTYYKDNRLVKKERAGYTNDASNLNETKVAEVVKPAAGVKEASAQLSALIKRATATGKKISIAGAQHSMGGHTIYPDAIVLDMKAFNYMQYDSINNLLLAGSGALWADIIPYLDARGKSIGVMQSNNSFSVGGSISVNCHGWQASSPPIASTVEALRLINAAGDVINCSRNENAELFSLVLGGYGLFGVILDVKLKVVDNIMYKAHQYVIKSTDYIKEYNGFVKANPGTGMAYGRININPGHFMEEAILSTFLTDSSAVLKRLEAGRFTTLRRTVFRGSANSDYGKNLRWKAEKLSTSVISGKTFARNQLLNEGVDVFQNTDTGYTDILHEYFIPESNAGKFIEAVKKVIPASDADLLNITVRNVRKDTITYLRYARENVFGFVMLFNQAKTSKAEAAMQLLTQKMVDITISLNGTYYLPYRLHATRDQFYKVYPNAATFFALKKKYDPGELFMNRFYEAYK